MVAHRIQVAVRVRPLNASPQAAAAAERDGAGITTTSSSVKIAALDRDSYTQNNKSRQYAFDHVFGSLDTCENSATQEFLFDVFGVPLVENAINSYNACILAYGQTGAGKTYSVLGSPFDEVEKGILPRTCARLFERLEEQAREFSNVTVLASYLEIYNERMRDLLSPSAPASVPSSTRRASVGALPDLERSTTPTLQKSGSLASLEKRGSLASLAVGELGNLSPTRDKRASLPAAGSGTGVGELQVRQHPTLGCTVPGLSETEVTSIQDVLRVCDRGNRQRATAETYMNAMSSRSHAIFTIEVRRTSVGFGREKEQQAKIHFVDLAGSEKQKRTGARGERLNEGIAINQSLTTLSRVILTLTSSDSKAVPPFRESKLTLLLKESLTGNSKTELLACISPAFADIDETVSTLEFASRCKLIETQVMKNEHTKFNDKAEEMKMLEEHLQQEREENSELRLQLAASQMSYEAVASSKLEEDELIKQRLSRLQVNDGGVLFCRGNSQPLGEECQEMAEQGLHEWKMLAEALQTQRTEHLEAISRFQEETSEVHEECSKLLEEKNEILSEHEQDQADLSRASQEQQRLLEEALQKQRTEHLEVLSRLQDQTAEVKEECRRLLEEKHGILWEHEQEQKDLSKASEEEQRLQKEQWAKLQDVLANVHSLQRQEFVKVKEQQKQVETQLAKQIKQSGQVSTIPNMTSDLTTGFENDGSLEYSDLVSSFCRDILSFQQLKESEESGKEIEELRWNALLCRTNAFVRNIQDSHGDEEQDKAYFRFLERDRFLNQLKEAKAHEEQLRREQSVYSEELTSCREHAARLEEEGCQFHKLEDLLSQINESQQREADELAQRQDNKLQCEKLEELQQGVRDEHKSEMHAEIGSLKAQLGLLQRSKNSEKEANHAAWSALLAKTESVTREVDRVTKQRGSLHELKESSQADADVSESTLLEEWRSQDERMEHLKAAQVLEKAEWDQEYNLMIRLQELQQEEVDLLSEELSQAEAKACKSTLETQHLLAESKNYLEGGQRRCLENAEKERREEEELAEEAEKLLAKLPASFDLAASLGPKLRRMSCFAKLESPQTVGVHQEIGFRGSHEEDDALKTSAKGSQMKPARRQYAPQLQCPQAPRGARLHFPLAKGKAKAHAKAQAFPARFSRSKSLGNIQEARGMMIQNRRFSSMSPKKLTKDKGSSTSYKKLKKAEVKEIGNVQSYKEDAQTAQIEDDETEACDEEKMEEQEGDKFSLCSSTSSGVDDEDDESSSAALTKMLQEFEAECSHLRAKNFELEESQQHQEQEYEIMRAKNLELEESQRYQEQEYEMMARKCKLADSDVSIVNMAMKKFGVHEQNDDCRKQSFTGFVPECDDAASLTSEWAALVAAQDDVLRNAGVALPVATRDANQAQWDALLSERQVALDQLLLEAEHAEHYKFEAERAIAEMEQARQETEVTQSANQEEAAEQLQLERLVATLQCELATKNAVFQEREVGQLGAWASLQETAAVATQETVTVAFKEMASLREEWASQLAESELTQTKLQSGLKHEELEQRVVSLQSTVASEVACLQRAAATEKASASQLVESELKRAELEQCVESLHRTVAAEEANASQLSLQMTVGETSQLAESELKQVELEQRVVSLQRTAETAAAESKELEASQLAENEEFEELVTSLRRAVDTAATEGKTVEASKLAASELQQTDLEERIVSLQRAVAAAAAGSLQVEISESRHAELEQRLESLHKTIGNAAVESQELERRLSGTQGKKLSATDVATTMDKAKEKAWDGEFYYNRYYNRYYEVDEQGQVIMMHKKFKPIAKFMNGKQVFTVETAKSELDCHLVCANLNEELEQIVASLQNTVASSTKDRELKEQKYRVLQEEHTQAASEIELERKYFKDTVASLEEKVAAGEERQSEHIAALASAQVEEAALVAECVEHTTEVTSFQEQVAAQIAQQGLKHRELEDSMASLNDRTECATTERDELERLLSIAAREKELERAGLTQKVADLRSKLAAAEERESESAAVAVTERSHLEELWKEEVHEQQELLVDLLVTEREEQRLQQEELEKLKHELREECARENDRLQSEQSLQRKELLKIKNSYVDRVLAEMGRCMDELKQARAQEDSLDPLSPLSSVDNVGNEARGDLPRQSQSSAPETFSIGTPQGSPRGKECSGRTTSSPVLMSDSLQNDAPASSSSSPAAPPASSSSGPLLEETADAEPAAGEEAIVDLPAEDPKVGNKDDESPEIEGKEPSTLQQLSSWLFTGSEGRLTRSEEAEGSIGQEQRSRTWSWLDSDAARCRELEAQVCQLKLEALNFSSELERYRAMMRNGDFCRSWSNRKRSKVKDQGGMKVVDDWQRLRKEFERVSDREWSATANQSKDNESPELNPS